MLTGPLGDVMKESAQAALTYARAHADELGIDSKIFSENDFHIHVPEGAIPKDGPSAGVTMATAMLSVCTERPGPLGRGHDRRDHPARQRPAGRRRQGEGPGRPAGRRQEDDHARGRTRRTSIEIPKKVLREIEFIFVEDVRDVFKNAMVKALGPSAKAAGKKRAGKA